MSEPIRVGVVGARGHTGSELLSILDRHPDANVAYAGSRELAGSPVPQVEGLEFGNLGPEEVAELDLGAVFLALPNGVSGPFVEALDEDTLVIDISADHRFDDSWAYGLPELYRAQLKEARRISNPGCYATAMQLAIAPFVDQLEGVPAVFGVSGYSGAGTTPSPRNDPDRLDGNLLPYSLTGHIHEREASRHLGAQVRFMPHVHPAFRGLLVTVHLPLERELDTSAALEALSTAYSEEPLVEVVETTPELRDGAGHLGVVIGGVATTENNVVLVAAEDNLLKGAAVQAVQNLNLGLGLGEFTGII